MHTTRNSETAGQNIVGYKIKQYGIEYILKPNFVNHFSNYYLPLGADPLHL